MARLGLLLTLVVTGFGTSGCALIMREAKKPKMTLAQVEKRLPIDAGWRGYVKDVHCQPAPQPFDYSCTFVNFGSVQNVKAGASGSLIKVGVIDVNGHAETGQEVGVNDPLGAAPMR
jgi:hypothetical protein